MVVALLLAVSTPEASTRFVYDVDELNPALARTLEGTPIIVRLAINSLSGHIFQTYVTLERDAPNVPAGFDTLNPDLSSVSSTQPADPSYAKTGAPASAVDADVHAPM